MTAPTPQFENIPDALKAERRWVVWKYQQRDGDKPTKVPYRADGTGCASSTNPATWTDFPTAQKAHEHGGCDGVGFVLGDGWCGVDLDHCIAPDGKIEPWAEEIIVRFTGAYREVSPSLTGVKIIGRGKTPDGPCKRKGFGPSNKGAIEIYDNGRYFTVTGIILEEKP